MAPIVRFSKVRKTFAELVVLEDLDLDVAPEERIAIIGASGSGKSTLLRILMTLERPDSGLVEVEGEPLWHMRRDGELVPADDRHLRRMRRKIGMVFQRFNLFPHMTVLSNLIEAPVHVLGLSKQEATERADALLETVGLAQKRDAYPAELSGGQQQRVAIARALAMRPKVLLFDEVTSALDPETVGDVLNVLRELAHDHSYTMLLVTHEIAFAKEIADRVCFLEHGRILEQGPPEQVLNDPKEPRTREFLQAVLRI